MSTHMNEEQARKRMADAGIDPTKWGDMGGHVGQPQFALRLAGNLKKLTAMLDGVVAEKQAEVRVLDEKLLRLKYGGGS